MKKTIIVIGLIVALSLGGFIVYSYSKQSGDDSSNETPQINTNSSAKDEIENSTEENVDPEASTNNSDKTTETPNSQEEANVFITDANQYDSVVEVRAFVSNIVEKGICELIFTKANERLTYEEPANPDASTTICTNKAINVSEFPQKGTWKVSVSYVSDHYKGVSEEREFEIR